MGADGGPARSGPPPPEPAAVAPSAGRTDRPNLVLVILDCVRAKSLGVFGGGRVARTPWIDRLAARGTLFRRGVAPANWTIPSHMSILTGALPWEHGVRTFRRADRPMPKIAEWLAASGYDTAVFTEEVHLVAGYGLEDGYVGRFARMHGTSDEERTASNRLFGHAGFVYSPAVRRMIERVPRLAIPLSAMNFRDESAFKREVCGDYLLEDFSRWLARRSPGQPLHALFNFVDAHEPYPVLAPRPIWGGSSRGFVQVPRYYLLAVPGLREQVPWEEVERAYLASIESADAKLGRIWRALEEAGEADRTLLVVTADHGQQFGEGGYVYHGCGATDSVLRVPLLAVVPGGAPVASVDRWTSLCEIPSWFKSAALGRPPFDPEGFAPVPFPVHPPGADPVLAEGGPASDPNRSLQGIGLENRWNHRLLAAYRSGEKYVWDLFSGELWCWPSAGGSGTAGPSRLEGEERERALRANFGSADAGRFLGRTEALVRPSLGDARMRSWGYD